jgi:cardiolipin synthase
MIGFTGGAAIADQWRGNAEDEDHWRDSMTVVTGPLVSGVQMAFGNDWVYCCGELLTGPRFYPQPPSGMAAPETEHGNTLESPDGDAIGVAVVSSPSDAEQPIRICYWLGFRAARKSLYISNSYFIPDKALRQAVTDRARATHYEELLRAGVRIYEYQPTMMHAKVVVVDGLWSVVGSANMDERSMELNEENVLAIRYRGLAHAIEAGLHDDFSKSKEIDLDKWCRRSIVARLLERCSRAMIEQY